MMRQFFAAILFPDGVVTRLQYLRSGSILFALKYAVDAFVVQTIYHRLWKPWDYLNMRWREIDLQDPQVVRFGILMLALSLPFIWSGVILTLKRVRDAQRPAWLVCLFFVPYVNLLLFCLLSFWHGRSDPQPDTEAPPLLESSRLEGFRHAAFNAVTVTVVCLAFVVFATKVLQLYGWGLFVGIPFLLGFIPSLMRKDTTANPFIHCLKTTSLILAMFGLFLLIFGVEGLICVLMAAPLVFALALFGAFVGYCIRQLGVSASRRGNLSCITILIFPLLLLSEKKAHLNPPLIIAKSSVEINAPSERVWRQVIAFPEIPPPKEWIFRFGIAYPIRAHIQGRGVGATRFCVFSTGAFVEPIGIWDEPRLLRFSVSSNPPPMRELSLYNIDPPHLHGFLESRGGQFELIALSENRTRLIGTTWYFHHLWPAYYWQFWSDYIIHTIHLRVLEHIKRNSERAE